MPLERSLLPPLGQQAIGAYFARPLGVAGLFLSSTDAAQFVGAGCDQRFFLSALSMPSDDHRLRKKSIQFTAVTIPSLSTYHHHTFLVGMQSNNLASFKVRMQIHCFLRSICYRSATGTPNLTRKPTGQVARYKASSSKLPHRAKPLQYSHGFFCSLGNVLHYQRIRIH